MHQIFALYVLNLNDREPVKLKALSHVVAVVTTFVTISFAYARIAANYRNYQGKLT